MRARFLLAMAGYVTLGMAQVAAATQLINFDDVAIGTQELVAEDHYLPSGILFDRPIPIINLPVVEPSFAVPFAAGGGTLPNAITLSIAGPNADLMIGGSFRDPGTLTPVTASFVQVLASDNQVGTLVGALLAYDTAGALIDSVAAITPESRTAVLSISAPEIASIRLLEDGDGGAFDNLMFELNAPCADLVVNSIEKCGVSGYIEVPVLARNPLAVQADLGVGCYVDGVLQDSLRVFGVPPDASRNLFFSVLCAPDQTVNVNCNLYAIPVDAPASKEFVCSQLAEVSCPAICCRPLFAARLSTASGGVPADFDSLLYFVTKSVGDRFYIRGSCSVGSSWIVDDELCVNGMSLAGHEGDRGIGFPVGVPLESIYFARQPVEITSMIPMGASVVGFRLRDTQGPIFGNSSLFLLKTSTNTIVGVYPDLESDDRPRLVASPNPTRGSVTFYRDDMTGKWMVSVVDINGRVVSVIQGVGPSAQWDGRNSMGVRVGAGVYFAVGSDPRVSKRLVVLK